MRLWLYLNLIINGVILFAFIAFGSFSASERFKLGYIDLQNDTFNLGQSIAASAANDLLLARLDRLESAMLRQVNIANVNEIMITDKDGHAVVTVKRSPSGEASVVYNYSASISVDGNQNDNLSDDAYSRTLPIDRGERIGWVRVSSSLKELQLRKRHILKETVIAALLTIAITSLVLGYFLRRFAKKLEAASEFASQLTHHTNLTLQTNNQIVEIDQLNASLNFAAHLLSTQFNDLNDNKARKDAMIEASLDCIITIDTNGLIVEFNPAAEKTFGYSRAEAIGQKMSALIIPEGLRQSHHKGMQHYLKTQEGPILHQRIELPALHRTGREFPVELSIVPFESGGQIYFLSSLRDISEKKEQEEQRKSIAYALELSVSRLTSMRFAMNQHAIISVADLQGNITFINEKFCQISQYTKEELVGNNHRILKSGLHPQSLYDDLWQTIASGNVWHGELANRRKDGEIFWAATSIVPINGTDGLAYQYISIRTDITQQKLIESQLQNHRQDFINLLFAHRDTTAKLEAVRIQEMAIGSQIQKSLLFGNLPDRVENFAIAVHTEASKGIDGDFYDFMQLDPDHFDLTIGDVMGKGIPAALIGAALKQRLKNSVIKQLINSDSKTAAYSPESIINSLHESITPSLISLDTFITLIYLRCDIPRKEITFVDAGHTQIIHAGLSGIKLLSGNNLPLGVIENEKYFQHQIDINNGDLIFIYSDGLTEVRNKDNEEFGVDRLSLLVQALNACNLPAPTLVQAVRYILREYESHKDLSDDRSCIAIQLRTPQIDLLSVHSINLPWNLNALISLRSEVGKVAREANLAQATQDELVLAANEAVTNVIRHAKCPLEGATLHCCLENTTESINVIFHYIGKSFTPRETMPDFSGDSEGGFGLFIIRNSVDEVIYDNPAENVCRISLKKFKALPAAVAGDDLV